jgi:hypothetical protein
MSRRGLFDPARLLHRAGLDAGLGPYAWLHPGLGSRLYSRLYARLHDRLCSWLGRLGHPLDLSGGLEPASGGCRLRCG